MKREKNVEREMLEEIREALMELARTYDAVEMCDGQVLMPTQAQVELRMAEVEQVLSMLTSKPSEPADGGQFPSHSRERSELTN